jgi:hypothetical protein
MSFIRFMIRRRAASSSSLQSAKALLRQISMSDATRPRVASSSRSVPSGPDSVAGTSMTAWFSISDLFRTARTGSGSRSS